MQPTATPDEGEHPSTNLPCAGGLVAGTLALMTAWAAPEPDASIDADQQRALIARKIVSNLFFLSHHPDVGAGLRHVIGNVHQRWLPMAQGARPVAPQADAALHASETEAALLH